MRTHHLRSERGSALVEAAITIPILLLITVGIFEVGRAYQTWQVVTNAAREGARVAILPNTTVGTVTGLVRGYMTNGQLSHAIRARLGQVLIAGQHLKEPQTEEDDREQRQRDRTDHGHAQRELRRQRRPAVFWCLDHRAAERGIWPRRSDGRCSGLSPPVV